MALSNKICLVILDGWGIGREDFSNAIYQAKTPFINEIKKFYPSTTLQASGIAVGLPFNEAGNSEVGHLTLGTGQIIYQYSVRISQAINNQTFFQNPAFVEICRSVKENQGSLHLIGLLSEALVHSSYEHLLALIDLGHQYNIKNIFLHLFTDGRDSLPTNGKEMLKRLFLDLESRPNAQIASLSGRFYGMDRDKNYNRTQKVYDLIVFGKGKTFSNPIDYLDNSYKENITDEFILPALCQKTNEDVSLKLIKEGDGIIFFNFREERMRQLTQAFIDPYFDKFPVKKFSKLKIATMTQYQKDFNALVAFPPQKISTCLAKVLSENNKRQLHLAESEKGAHVTFFFDGLKEEPYPGEYWVIIPSLKTLHLEDYPELMAEKVSARLLQAFEENIYDFILVNYANPDLIGHTGNIEAGIECATIIDKEVKKIVEKGLGYGYTFLITADHGNLERMANPYTGEVETEHDVNPVPFYLVDNRFKRNAPRSETEIKSIERSAGGMLADVSPTILELFGLKPPKEMTGQSLLPLLGIY
ncbi:MAG: 2,3-bisphosphoglycerate-independent phosphoglycerate mutase [Minisyncoccia bacterium]